MRDATTQPSHRVRAAESWLEADGAPLRVRGATYGTFRSRPDGARFPEAKRVRSDFAAMAAVGFNTVRVYTVPTWDVLEAAEEHGVRLIVGLDYDDWRMVPGADRSTHRTVLANGRRAVERAMRVCAESPHVLGISVGNEVPVDLVRLAGIGEVERCLERLIADVHASDPDMLVTYTNYPSTEFIDPGGQDLVTWNVFLEQPDAFRRYLDHLLALAGPRPLLLTEFGLSAGIHGEPAQAEHLAWQTAELDACGAAGGTVFSWTDEWAVADVSVDTWDFGLVRADRSAKPALVAAQRWGGEGDRHRSAEPTTLVASVVVCAFNEANHIERCIDSVLAQGRDDIEIILCDDGSTDGTADLVADRAIRTVRLPHVGLSAARNAGLAAATAEYVVYLDADAEAGPDWVSQLVRQFERSGVVAVGGPNHPFALAGFVEQAVAQSPGNPREVLTGDTDAEHIAGCNMAFRRTALEAIGGFDVSYRAAGDDVDVCWKLIDAGGAIAFAPRAAVRHHRRSTVRGFLRQQRGYGRAERMLQGPHRHRFNRLGQARWKGVVYGGMALPARWLRPVVYHGPLGLEPFQSVRRRPGHAALATLVALLPMFVAATLVGLMASAIAASWAGAIASLVVMIVPMLGVGVSASAGAAPPRSIDRRLAFRVLVGFLHVAQPLARVWGRLTTRSLPPATRETAVWTGSRLAFVDEVVAEAGGRHWHVAYGTEHDAFDLELRKRGLVARVNLATVWDWSPRWAVRFRPRVALWVAAVIAVLVNQSAPLAAAVVGLVLLDTIVSAHVLRTTIRVIASRAELVVTSSVAADRSLSPAAPFADPGDSIDLLSPPVSRAAGP